MLKIKIKPPSHISRRRQRRDLPSSTSFPSPRRILAHHPQRSALQQVQCMRQFRNWVSRSTTTTWGTQDACGIYLPARVPPPNSALVHRLGIPTSRNQPGWPPRGCLLDHCNLYTTRAACAGQPPSCMRADILPGY